MTATLAVTADVAARLTGLSEHQLRRWDNDGFLQPEFAAPDRGRPHSRIYSFQDLVKLRTISRLRQQGVPTKRLKKIGRFLDKLERASWSESAFYVIAGDVYFSHDEALVAARPLGQQAIRDIVTVDLRPIVDDVEQGVSALRKRAQEDIGQVRRDRYIMGGQPVIAGTRIPTSTVYEFVRRGYGTEDIIREFPRLVPEDIDAAINEERGNDGSVARLAG